MGDGRCDDVHCARTQQLKRLLGFGRLGVWAFACCSVAMADVDAFDALGAAAMDMDGAEPVAEGATTTSPFPHAHAHVFISA